MQINSVTLTKSNLDKLCLVVDKLPEATTVFCNNFKLT
ncbi:MAG: hypothetical protein OFPII_38040 [Osedax symbiont Rs1]|nr:MAG: hypothetical protein OFPII_38040 [Osedax symbiont Rs1]